MDDISYHQAKILKIHLSLFARGLKHSNVRGRRILRIASSFTTKDYPRGAYNQAIEDLVELIQTHEKLAKSVPQR